MLELQLLALVTEMNARRHPVALQKIQHYGYLAARNPRYSRYLVEAQHALIEGIMEVTNGSRTS